jgi:[protein-PII] uridylyltransferase
VLDEFSITNADGRSAVTQEQLQQMTFLLEGALSEPPRFASIWACSRHKFLAPPSTVAAQISFDNIASPESTVVRIIAGDRIGLLYDILQAIADTGLNVKQARIETEGNIARDTIHVIDARGEKIHDDRPLALLRARLDAVLTESG